MTFITYFLMAGYVLVFLVTNLLLKGLYQIKENILTGEEELNHFLLRGFMEMPVFRMKNQFPGEIRKALQAKEGIVSSKVKMTMIHEAFFTIFALLVACLDVGVLAYAWKSSHLSVGSVVALITLIDNAYDTPFKEICVQNLSFSYENRTVLDHVNLRIKRGEKVAFVGESGSGKSTLVKVLMGLLKYESGDILFDDTPFIGQRVI